MMYQSARRFDRSGFPAYKLGMEMPPSLFGERARELRSRAEIMRDVRGLVEMWKRGLIGGARMPEDSRPVLEPQSAELVSYLSLPMGLNYQRDSYALWKSATRTFADPETSFAFYPTRVVHNGKEHLRSALLKFKVALQPNRHVETWWRVSNTICDEFGGDLRALFERERYDAAGILSFVRRNKKRFPCLCGNKIGNYWLYVINLYSGYTLNNLAALSIAPDTHVIQASIKLGVIEPVSQNGDLARNVAGAWLEILAGTEFSPIDIHTPLWLWSRAGFPPVQN